MDIWRVQVRHKMYQMIAQKSLLKLLLVILQRLQAFVWHFIRILILLANIRFEVKMLTSLLRLIWRRSRRNNFQTQFLYHLVQGWLSCIVAFTCVFFFSLIFLGFWFGPPSSIYILLFFKVGGIGWGISLCSDSPWCLSYFLAYWKKKKDDKKDTFSGL